jgi:two-component system sensor histidine kinase YesM
MLDKDATLIDQRFSAMANSVYLMMNDASINELLVSSSYSKPLLLQSNERELESLIGQYISDPDGIAIIYIIASNYSCAFMDRIGLPSMVAPENVLCAEKLRSASGKIVWMPTAGFDGFLSLGERYSRYFQDFEAFTLGVQMNLAYVKYGYLHTLADEQPFVLISILPSIFDQWLTSEHLLSDTTYTIYDADRALVYASADIDAAFDLEQLPLAKNQSVSVTHMPDKRGVDNIVCSRMLEETGWIITSYTPVNQAFLYFGSYISVASLVVLVITALIVGISVVFSTRSITRPLNILSAALKQTAVGNYAYRITDTSHPDYLDTFMLYNSMNEHIAQLIKENYETKLSEKNLEIQVINMQFNPHFLYNTLMLSAFWRWPIIRRRSAICWVRSAS